MSLQNHFPQVQIVGEEGNDVTMTSYCREKSQIPDRIKVDHKLNQLTAWIDPLDGTAEMLDGNLENVTIMIGLSSHVTQRPIAGFIHQPFYGDQGRTIWV